MNNKEWIERFEKVLKDQGVEVVVCKELPNIPSQSFSSDLLTRFENAPESRFLSSGLKDKKSREEEAEKEG